MTETENGGLPGAAANRVGRDFNDMLIEDGHEAIVDLLESDSDADLIGVGAPAAGADPDEEHSSDKNAEHPPSASPRSWGFDVKEINRSYALAIWGGKAVVVNEQPSGPVNDRSA